jgi:hypothetical protein
MKWTLKLVAESDSGETTVHEVAILNRAEAFIKSAALGMSIEESKQIAAKRLIYPAHAAPGSPQNRQA